MTLALPNEILLEIHKCLSIDDRRRFEKANSWPFVSHKIVTSPKLVIVPKQLILVHSASRRHNGYKLEIPFGKLKHLLICLDSYRSFDGILWYFGIYTTEINSTTNINETIAHQRYFHSFKIQL